MSVSSRVITRTANSLFRAANYDHNLRRAAIVPAAVAFRDIARNRSDLGLMIHDGEILARRCADAIIGNYRHLGVESLDAFSYQKIEALAEALSQEVLEHFTSADFRGAFADYSWDFTIDDNGQRHRILHDLESMPGLTNCLAVAPGLSAAGLYAVVSTTTMHMMRREGRALRLEETLDSEADHVFAWADTHETAVFELLQTYQKGQGLAALPCFRTDPFLAALITDASLTIEPVMVDGRAQIRIAGDHPWSADDQKSEIYRGFNEAVAGLEAACRHRLKPRAAAAGPEPTA